MANEYDNPLLREENARGYDTINRLRNTWIHICGLGAIGSNLALNLARQGAEKLVLIDHDRVSPHNISTSTYTIKDSGRKKADTVVRQIGMDLGFWPESRDWTLTAKNVAKLLGKSDLVVDALDNHESRRIVAEFCESKAIPCLHAGMSADGMYGECVWNRDYAIPEDVEGDPCDVAATRNLIMFVVAIASEMVVEYLTTGRENKSSITLKDMFLLTQRWK